MMYLLKFVTMGRGSMKKIIDRIFEPFVTTKLAQGGMGLGLPFVYSIMQAHNARISGGNSEDGGAAFQLVFPATSLPGG
jgi:two-component system, sporulation sensor kinase E